MKTFNRLQFVLPTGGVLLVGANLMHVCAVQLGIKLVDDALEHLHFTYNITPINTQEWQLDAMREAISMLEEIRMRLARDYDDARTAYSDNQD